LLIHSLPNINRNHPDFGCYNISESNTNCIGASFDTTDSWDNPVSKYHGTHVAGTIGATALNNDGIRGIISDTKFCFIIGRVFAEEGDGTRMSTILDATEWAASKGANVINMSLGTATPSQTGRSVMQSLYNRGILLVAAAGNLGTDAKHYPASFPTVMSVAAVDEYRNHASFSQYNAGVDISGPGVNVLSTYPLNLGGAVFIESSTIGVFADYLKYSTRPNKGTFQGVVIYCPNLGLGLCPGPGNHICLIER
jgi:serine protease